MNYDTKHLFESSSSVGDNKAGMATQPGLSLDVFRVISFVTCDVSVNNES